MVKFIHYDIMMLEARRSGVIASQEGKRPDNITKKSPVKAIIVHKFLAHAPFSIA